jgi:uncharacterized protein YndB with AHSA1/START domain
MRNEETITIDRPIYQVFSYLSDVERHPQWVSSVLATTKTSDGPMGLGATFTEAGKTLGRQLEVSWEITAYEPPHTIQQRMRMDPTQVLLTVTLEAITGGTKVTIVEEGEMRGIVTLRADLETLKTLTESAVTAAP